MRKLNREDLPGSPRRWRWIPQMVLDWVGRAFGWYVIAKAVDLIEAIKPEAFGAQVAANVRKTTSAAGVGCDSGGIGICEGLQPGTKEYFESVIRLRSGYELRSVLKLIPFKAFAGSKVLEVGCGAGYDARGVLPRRRGLHRD